MKSFLRAAALLAALATGGCSGLNEVDDRPEREGPPRSCWDHPRAGNLFDAAAAAGQLLYDFSQDH
jgi:hypothetical protein